MSGYRGRSLAMQNGYELFPSLCEHFWEIGLRGRRNTCIGYVLGYQTNPEDVNLADGAGRVRS